MPPPKPPIFYMAVGDRRTSLRRTLRQGGAVVDVTGLTVEFKMVDKDGTIKVNWSPATINDAANGDVQYDWAVADVDTAGRYFYWFRITGAGLESTFPPDGETAEVHISGKPPA